MVYGWRRNIVIFYLKRQAFEHKWANVARPFARRRFKTRLPALVDWRARKP